MSKFANRKIRNRAASTLLLTSFVLGANANFLVTIEQVAAQTATDPIAVWNDLNLPEGQMRALICLGYLAIRGTNHGLYCNVLSNQPQFYSSNPVVYNVTACPTQGAPTQVIGQYGNLAATLRDPSVGTMERPFPSNFPVVASFDICPQTLGSATFRFPGAGRYTPGPAPGESSLNLVLIENPSGYAPRRSASEPTLSANDNFIFIYRTGDASRRLTFDLQLGGTAVLGQDYIVRWGDNDNIRTITSLPATVSLDPNDRLMGVSIIPLFRNQDTPEKTVSVTVPRPAGFSQTFRRSVTARIAALDVPDITFTQIETNPIQPGPVQLFRVTRSNQADLSNPVSVRYSIGGSATNGTDYSLLSEFVTIPAGQTSAVVSITAAQPEPGRPQKTLVITPQGADGYVLNSTQPLTFTLPANLPPSLSVASSGSGVLSRGSSGGFTISRPAGGE